MDKISSCDTVDSAIDSTTKRSESVLESLVSIKHRLENIEISMFGVKTQGCTDESPQAYIGDGKLNALSGVIESQRITVSDIFDCIDKLEQI